MTREELLFQGVKNKLQKWLSFIQKASVASDVKIESGQNSEFYVKVIWEKPSYGEYKKLFDRRIVFGRSYSLSPGAWTVQKCAGDFARDVVREVLQARGI